MQHEESGPFGRGAVVVGDPPVPAGLRVLARVAATAAGTAVTRHRPSLVVVDLVAPAARDQALAAIAALTSRAPDVPVLAVAAPDAGHDLVLDAVRAGATGVATTADPAGLAGIAAATAEGRAAFSPGLAAVVLESVAVPARSAVPELSPRESEVLGLVVEGLTARQIAARLVLSPRTVENHVQRLLRKFDVPGRGALVRLAIEYGLA